MFYDNPDAERLHEYILEPSSIELTITVTPVIYSLKKRFYYGDRITEEEGNIPLWYCLFEVRAGKDKAFMFSCQADGSHEGKREGSRWEDTKQIWQSQYDYIRQYIGFVMLSAGGMLVEQAHLARGYRGKWGECDWDLLSKEAMGALVAVMSPYQDRDNKAREEKNRDLKLINSLDLSWRTINLAMHHLVSFFMPLQGNAHINAGKSKTSLRFSITQLERLRLCYEGYQNMWSTAAAIVDSRRSVNRLIKPYDDEKWEKIKAEINQVCQLPDKPSPRLGKIPDHLLDELRPRKSERSYEPYQLAYVHAAIECGIMVAGPAWPKASNWRVISDALQEYMCTLGKSLEVRE